MSREVQNNAPQRRSEQAAALIEFALLLPFLLVILTAIIDFSISGRYESAVIRALGAANRSVMASAGDGLNDDVTCAESAGRAFLEVLSQQGGLREAEFDYPGISEKAVMSLSVMPRGYINHDPDNMDPIRLSGWFTQRCYFCAMTDAVMSMFSARLFQPRVKSSLVSVSEAGGCYPKASAASACRFPGAEPVEAIEWEGRGREIVVDSKRGLWCCHNHSCNHVGSV